MWAWYWIVFGLSKDVRVALGAAALVALDHTVLSAANGRPDLMGNAWGMLGMAGYLSSREHGVGRACFLGYLGAALAGLTHPLPGVLAFANITLLLVLLDRNRFDLKALAAALAPFALGALAVASAPGAASVRVWPVMSRGRDPSQGRPPPEGVHVAYPLVADPQVRAREMFVELDHPVYGPLKTTGTPLKLSETPGRVRWLAPMPGQDNQEVFVHLLGHSPDDLERWRAEGVI